MTDAYQATLDPRVAPQGDALAAPRSADPLDADYRRNIEAVQRSMGSEQDIARERSAALAGPRADIARMTRQPLPQPPTAQQLPAAPQARNEPGADETWLMAASVLGAIAGGFTRRHVTNALAAMTGAMEGYQQGSKDRFEAQLKQWKAEGEKAREANEQANTKYRQILESRKMALDQKLEEIQLTAATFDDRAAMQLAQTRNLEALGRLIEQRSQHQDRMLQAGERLKQQYAQMEQRERLAEKANQARVQAAEKRSQGAGMSPEAIDMRAELALQGNPLATKGMRAGSPDFANFSNRLAEMAKERGISADEVTRLQTRYAGETSYQRTGGTMAARVESASNEVAQLAPQALQASSALPRDKFVPVNRLRQAYEAGTSNPAYNDFLMANFALEKAYGRAMNPQGVPRVTEAMEAKAEGILSVATSPEAYATQVRRILMEVEASKRAVAATREGVKPAPAATPGAPRASADMPVPDPEGWLNLGTDPSTGKPIRYREISGAP